MTTIIYKSKFKKLIVSGCSCTQNRVDTSHVWANLLADLTGMEIVNLANAGAGNAHIANSLIMYLARYCPDPNTTLVMTMWSGIDRTDWIVDQNKIANNRFNFKFEYDKYTEHYIIGTPEFGKPRFKDYLDLQSEKTFSLNSWLNFEALTNYLKVQGYTYRYTVYNDILYGKGMSPISFLDQIKILGLTLDLENWILTKGTDSLKEYALYHNEMIPEESHPTLLAQENWTREKLVPLLLKQNIIHE